MKTQIIVYKLPLEDYVAGLLRLKIMKIRTAINSSKKFYKYDLIREELNETYA